MLKNVLLAGLIIFIISCQSKPDKAITLQSSSADTTQQVIAKLKPVLQGVWIKQDYLQTIIDTKSPLLAADKAVGITTMQIDTAGIAGDSLKVAVTYDNQQYGDVPLKFKPGKNKTAMLFGENELGYRIANGDTTLLLYQFYQKQWVISTYLKSLPKLSGNDLQEGLAYLINKNLFSGKYSHTDSLGKVKPVVFGANGGVSGFGSFNHYTVENTFADKTMNNLDQITFNQFSSSEKTFAFKIEQRILRLFDIKKDERSRRLLQGKLEYTLKRL